jgi:hypothetical protein
MQFSGKLTEQDLKDVQRVARSKMYWPKLFLANWYGVTLLGILLWATFAGLFGAIHPNWSAIGGMWVVFLSLFAWAFYSTKRKTSKELLQLNATQPDWINLAEDGAKLSGPNGAAGFWPWNNFKAWREGKRVMLLDMPSGAFVILSIGDLSDGERESIRQFLRSHVASASATAANPV